MSSNGFWFVGDEVEMNWGLYFGRVRVDDIFVSVLFICDGVYILLFLFID